VSIEYEAESATVLVWTFQRREKFLYLLVMELFFLGCPVFLPALY
jgi:hypothetical protein